MGGSDDNGNAEANKQISKWGLAAQYGLPFKLDADGNPTDEIDFSAIQKGTYKTPEQQQAEAQKYMQGIQGQQQLAQIGAQGDIQKALQASSLGESSRQFNVQQQAYNDAIKRAQEQSAQGEQGVLASTAQAPSELTQMKEDILSGQNKQMQAAANQAKANLAQSGVRGGQAATALNRATGDIASAAAQNVNQLAYQDAINRQAAKTNMYAQKAAAGYGK